MIRAAGAFSLTNCSFAGQEPISRILVRNQVFRLRYIHKDTKLKWIGRIISLVSEILSPLHCAVDFTNHPPRTLNQCMELQSYEIMQPRSASTCGPQLYTNPVVYNIKGGLKSDDEFREFIQYHSSSQLNWDIKELGASEKNRELYKEINYHQLIDSP